MGDCRWIVVVNKQNKRVCGTLIKGKNSTSLVSYPRRMHKSEYKVYLQEIEEKNNQINHVKVTNAGDDATAMSSPTASSSQTIVDCVNRKIIA